MARRRKSDDAAAGFLALIIVAAVIAAAALLFGLAIAAPIFFPIWWIRCEVRRAMQPRKRPDATIGEIAQIKALNNLLIEHEDSRINVYKIGDQSGIPRRTDSLFDGRYGAGRDVNSQLEQIDSEIDRLSDALYAINNQISSRLVNWHDIKAQNIGARVAVAAYAIVFTFIISASPPWALEFGRLTDKFGVTLSDLAATLFGGSAAASVVAGVALLIVTSVNRTTS